HGPAGPRNLQRMLDVPLSLTVELGSTEMPLAEVLRLDAGAVITIDRLPGEPIDLLINGRHFARGEVVVINETFGFRITELVDDPEESIEVPLAEGEQR
ncbi:MAG: flagellar motor switch protein FliN, partial [Armatimonadota bacterium]